MKQENWLFGARVPESNLKCSNRLTALADWCAHCKRGVTRILLAMVLVTPWMASAQQPPLQVLRVEGEVGVIASHGDVQPLQPGDALNYGQKIRLMPGSRLSMIHSDGSPIDWEAPEGNSGSEIRIRRPHSDSLWKSGRAWASALWSQVARTVIQLRVGSDPYLTPDYENAVAGNRLGH